MSEGNPEAFKAFVAVLVKSTIETCAQFARMLSLDAETSCRVVVDELIGSAEALMRNEEPKEQEKAKRLDA